MRFLLLFALLPSLALGQAVQRGPQPALRPAGAAFSSGGASLALSIPFAAPTTPPGCYITGSVMGTKGEILTVSRATTKLCNTGSLVTCPVNAACVEASGLLVEPTRTNYVLNSATHPKASEASSALPTGSFVAWHAGTGTMTVAAGTAVVTGLSCSAVAAGTICSFTVSTGGTMTVTTTAGTTHTQIENGPFRTTQITTTGAAATRAAETISVANPLVGVTQWCVDATGTPQAGRTWANFAGRRVFWSIGVYGTANSAYADNDWGDSYLYAGSRDGANGAREAYFSAGGLAGTRRITASFAGDTTLFIDGVLSVSGRNGAGTGVMSAQPAAIYLGDPNYAFGGYIRDFKVYRKASCR